MSGLLIKNRQILIFMSLLFYVCNAASLLFITAFFALTYANKFSLLEQELIRPIYKDEKLDKEKIALGEKLFFDKRLSHDNSISCATCHRFESGGSDTQQFATGIKGQKSQVNTPTVFNSRYNIAQFWDGRAQSLEQQALAPVENPLEMGSSWPEVVAKLSQDTFLKKDFKHIYNKGISAELVADAIAEYERSLVTIDAPFDRYLLGDTEAISERARQGYILFKSYGCISCHQGINVGGNLFHKLGVMIAYFAPVDEQLLKRDLGQFNVTRQIKDKFRFKVPSLRLVVKTAPYFHDGSIKTLNQAIKIMAKYQLLREISDDEVRLIIEFLKTLPGRYERTAYEK